MSYEIDSKDPAALALALIEKYGQTTTRDLSVAYLGLTELPSSLCDLTDLRTLDLSGNKLTALPESIGKLTQLEYLNVSTNQLESLPGSLSNLKNLRILNLHNNCLAFIPDFICELSSLEALNLASNRIELLPEDFWKLTQLVSLNLADNNLTRLPTGICKLTELNTLILVKNKLDALPEMIGELSNLQSLLGSANNLIDLPDSIGRLRKLTILTLYRNKLKALPESVGDLINLERFGISDNRIVALPYSIGGLKNLTSLGIARNKLKYLPESIGKLGKLRRLNLSKNSLAALPNSMHKLTKLTELYLHGNKKLMVPTELLGSDWKAVREYDGKPTKPSKILKYYFRLQQGKRPINEAKLILVGRGGVGKTSLVNRLLHDRFDRDEPKTEGIRITEWKLEFQTKETIRLNIWDFGGQEIMHATHQFFLTQRSIYLLVITGREGGEDADAEYWLRLIESFGEQSPIIVVLNKTREHPFDVNRRALCQKYVGIRDFIKTDCEDGTGLDQLRSSIERETTNLESLRDPFPTAWFTIKNKLAEMKENFLTFERYRKLCELNGEKDPKAQEELSGYLHILGIILNYNDDPRLQDTHVLNPLWVTNGIYKILNSARLEMQKGEVGLNDVAEVLDANEYPPTMRLFIFDLMKKFELCFSFPDSETHYLIPQLLDKQEPEEAVQFTLRECLNFQYVYSVLPEGLLPRFIVRSHALSINRPRWRTGVILEFEGCSALVKADLQDKRIFISVCGPIGNRRRLLAVIRSDFERIHRDIRNLQPSEMVQLSPDKDAVVPYEKLLAMEREGIESFPEFVGGGVVYINVCALLNGLDIDNTRRRKSVTDQISQTVKVFYSYSHKDEDLRNELETHLKLLQRQGLIRDWSDRKIEAGDDWRHEIDENLQRADIILLLVSADFIASEYCFEKEMKFALERHKNNSALVIPIIVRDVNLEGAPFSGLQYLPKDGKAVTLWENRDSAWRSVSEGIEKCAKNHASRMQLDTRK